MLVDRIAAARVVQGCLYEIVVSGNWPLTVFKSTGWDKEIDERNRTKGKYI